MYRSSIVVADPAKHTPELECFNVIAAMSELPCSYHLPCLFGIKSIEAIPFDCIRGIIVLGSSASVNDAESWQLPFNRWLSAAMHRGIPTLGCCYGHQLVAHLFGAPTDFLLPSREKIRGFRSTTLSPDPRLGLPGGNRSLVVSHREAVMRVPDAMECWATSPISPNDGFRHRTLPIWTLQPHPEATPLFLDDREIPQPSNHDAFSPGHEIVAAFLRFSATARSH